MSGRRILAFLLVVAMIVSNAEALVAEVHDGDASVAELASAGGPSTICPEGISSEHAGLPADHGGHSAHVCHLGHSHGGWIGVSNPVFAVSMIVSEVSQPVEQSPDDFISLPQVPPPIR